MIYHASSKVMERLDCESANASTVSEQAITLESISSCIRNMSESEYCELMKQAPFRSKLATFLNDSSQNRYECVEKILDWNIGNSNCDYRNILIICVNVIYYSLMDIERIPNDMLEKIILLENIWDNCKADPRLRIESIICDIQSYPTCEFEYFFNLIFDNHDLQKTYDNPYMKYRWSSYSLKLLQILTNFGIKINFQDILCSICWCTDNPIDKVHYVIDNLDAQTLSKKTLALIYKSNVSLFEIIISRTNAIIDFSLLDLPILLFGINSKRMNILVANGYNFEQIILDSTHNCQKSCTAIKHENRSQSKYLTNLVENMNLCDDTLRCIVNSLLIYNKYTAVCYDGDFSDYNDCDDDHNKKQYDDDGDYEKYFYE